MKKRILSVLLLTFLLVSLLPTTALAAQNEITVYNWGQYISDGTDDSMDVIKEFEAETGIKVNYLTFDSNESMYTKLKTGGTSYDVIIPSDYMIAKLISEDMLEPIDFANTPNYQYIDEAFRNQAYDPENKYSVPYTWGTVGLIYNTQYVSDEDAKSWSCLWNSKYAGKLLMFDNPRDAFAIAESMLGYSYNTEDAQELKNAADLLATQKPVLQAYVMDQIFDKLERGEAWAAPYYAGDYLTMVEENPDLAFSFPEEGFNIFIDAMCIPKGCQNKEGAEAFINFLCRPDVFGGEPGLHRLLHAGDRREGVHGRRGHVESPVSYPDDETCSRAAKRLQELGIEATQTMNDLWLSVKTDGANTTLYLALTHCRRCCCHRLLPHFRRRHKAQKSKTLPQMARDAIKAKGTSGHSGVPFFYLWKIRKRLIPRLSYACFSSSISRLCWRTTERRTETSSSSSSTRLFGASVSSMVC